MKGDLLRRKRFLPHVRGHASFSLRRWSLARYITLDIAGVLRVKKVKELLVDSRQLSSSAIV